jgi:hypothetical protein
MQAAVELAHGDENLGNGRDQETTWQSFPVNLPGQSTSGQVWKSTPVLLVYDFEVTASSLQEFLEQVGRRIANQT